MPERTPVMARFPGAKALAPCYATIVLLGAAPAAAQTPYLVRDIDTRPGWSEPRDFTGVGTLTRPTGCP